jgi:hypothetical protein
MMQNSENKSKELRYADYQVVAERSVCVELLDGLVFNPNNSTKTILAHGLKWFVRINDGPADGPYQLVSVNVSGFDELLKVDKAIGECTAVDFLLARQTFDRFDFIYDVYLILFSRLVSLT